MFHQFAGFFLGSGGGNIVKQLESIFTPHSMLSTSMSLVLRSGGASAAKETPGILLHSQLQWMEDVLRHLLEPLNSYNS